MNFRQGIYSSQKDAENWILVVDPDLDSNHSTICQMSFDPGKS